ncbi:MAG: accessory gene regulator B family protein [bacterium]|nr:accessory gene regulator B family protein [bacterium]
MKKDLNKIISTILKVYVFLLLIVFILKLVGLDYFGLDVDNPIVVGIDKFAKTYHLENVWYFITLYIYTYVILSISCNDKSKWMKLFNVVLLPLSYLVQKIDYINASFWMIIFTDLMYLYLIAIIYNLIFKRTDFKGLTKRYWLVMALSFIFQFLSAITRVSHLNNLNYGFIVNIVLDLDYLLLSLMSHELYFKKGVGLLCGEVAGLFSRLLTSSRSSLTKFLTSFSQNSKKAKFEFILFTILFLLWNVFTIAVVLFFAYLNGTLIECIFILNAFWVSKTVFGKPFHMKNASQCFLVSNITYYCLNRVTSPIGISLLIPIALGILLSYFTSKLVKKDELSKPLYRGMPVEDFYKIIKTVTNNKLDIKICKLFYCDRLKEEKIAQLVNYSKESVQKHKRAINDKLKGLR